MAMEVDAQLVIMSLQKQISNYAKDVAMLEAQVELLLNERNKETNKSN